MIYNKHGLAGFSKKMRNGSYSKEFKMKVVEEYVRGDGSSIDLGIKYDIRKREERKDRLHQNYLKRKASGAQKQYENKIKDKRKAEIEAKKAAIRAEDIAKGVFVPVSQLPAKEPKKGVQTA